MGHWMRDKDIRLPKSKMVYTTMEEALNREAGENRGRLLSALWITGKGPRGGKVNIGQHRYDALNLLVIENKAEVVSRFSGTPTFATLQVHGIVIRFPKIKATAKVIEPKAKVHVEGKPPWEQ
jgi:hypothetical protein